MQNFTETVATVSLLAAMSDKIHFCFVDCLKSFRGLPQEQHVPVSLSNCVGFTPLLLYHSPAGLTQLKNG